MTVNTLISIQMGHFLPVQTGNTIQSTLELPDLPFSIVEVEWPSWRQACTVAASGELALRAFIHSLHAWADRCRVQGTE